MSEYHCRPKMVKCSIPIFNFVTWLLFLMVLTGASFTVLANSSKKLELSFNFNDSNYHALIYLPETIEPNASYPLIIVAPGANDRASRFVRVANFSKLAGSRAFVIAYPKLEETSTWLEWLTVSNAKNNYAAGFFRSLIRKLSSQVSIRAERIYLVGFSAGGMLVLTAMCDMANDIAAFSVVSATLPAAWRPGCNIEQSVPLLLIASRDDPVIPWSGGGVAMTIKERQKISLLSVTDTIDIWRVNNGCNARPLLKAHPNVDPSDGTTVTRLAYDFECSDSAIVLLYAIKGGGHSWPGSKVRLRSFKGAISQDIQATELIWEFVRKYRLRQ